MKARVEVLEERNALQFAALDCWKALAEELPEGVVVQSFNLTGGKQFQVNGTAPASESQKLLDLFLRLRRLTPNGRQLFSRNAGEAPILNPMGADTTMRTWRLSLELERTDQP
jgi:hypothetical protein